MLQEQWTGQRVVELEGLARVTRNEIGAAFSRILGHPVLTQKVPRDSWEELFRGQGMKNPTPRAQMLDGFNEGWIEFEGTPRKGETTIDTVVTALVG
jgi:uncharacterized protein YbjT (DUF2867 family)